MDADSVTKVERDEEEDQTDPYAYNLNVEYNRNGPTQIIPIRFLKHMSKFE